MPNTHCLQTTYAAGSICYGCGPANPHGLHIESFPEGALVVAHWQPEPHHHAFENILSGGIIGSILDCHCNWAAAWFLMQAQGLPHPPSTVTAEYHVKLLRPTPMTPLRLTAKLIELQGNKRAIVEGQLFSGDTLCDTCLGTFVAVGPEHPAFRRW